MEQEIRKGLNGDRVDKTFSLIYFLIGYALVYTFTSSEFDRNLAIFTVFYAAAVLIYCWRKRIRPSAESYFWLVVMLAIGIPYAFWSVFRFLQVVGLIFVAAYWTLSVSGRFLSDGKTSQFLFFDGFNALCIVPFGNFDAQFRVLFARNNSAGGKKENYLLSVLIGAAIAIPALIIILPLLSRADAGFEQMLREMLNYIREHLLLTMIRIILAIPVACYLYGLIFGSIRGRNTDCISTTVLQAAGKSVRIIPDIAIGTAMTVICLVYVAFVGLQGNYMFSAFAGSLPEEFTYAEYARRGFFELCQIGAWNMVILGGLSLFSKNERKENKTLRIMTICLSVLTLLIIATAMSKMGMYIVAYGLTVKRILTMVFMIWMVIVFVGIMIQQKKEISLARICIMVGAVLFSLLCVCPVENWIELYNRTFFP